MADLSSVTVWLRANTTDFTAKMAGAQTTMSSTAAKFTTLGTSMSKYVTLPLLAVAGASIAAAADVGTGYRIIAQRTAETGAALENLRGSFDVVFSNVPQSASVVGEAIADIASRTGLTGEKLETLSTTLLNLARITNSDVSEVTRTATRVFGDWSIATDDQNSSLDYLYGISAKTGISITQLMEGMSAYGSPMRALGFSFEEVGALLGNFERAGVKTELAMGGLRKGLASLAKAGKDPTTELPILLDKIKNAGTVAESNTVAFELFGARCGADLAVAIREGKFGVQDFIDALKENPTAINDVAASTLTFSDKLKMLKNNASVALRPIGLMFFDIANAAIPILSKITKWMQAVGKAFKSLPAPAKKFIGVIVLLAAAIGPLILIGVKLIGLFKTIKTAWLALQTAFMANPMVLLIMAIVAAVILVAVIIKKNWTSIKNFFVAIWNGIKAVWDKVWGAIAGTAKAIWGGIVNTAKVIWGVLSAVFNVLAAIWKGIWTGIVIALKVIWTILKIAFIAIIFPFVAAAIIIWEALKIAWGVVWGVISKVLSAVWAGLKNLFNAIILPLVKVAAAIWDAVKAAWNFIWNGIKIFLQNLWNGIVVVFHMVIDPLITLATAIWNILYTTWQFIWNAIVVFLQNLWRGVVTIFHAVIDPLVAVATAVWDGITAAWEGIWNGIVTVVTGVWNTIVSVFHAVIDPLVAVMAGIWDGVKSAWDTVWGGIESVITGVVDTVKKAWNWLAEKWNAVEITVKEKKILGVTVMPGFTLGLPDLPTFAKGGIATSPTAGIFGEAGNEALIPLPAGFSINDLVGGGGQQNSNTFNITINSAGEDYDAKKLADAINEHLNQLAKKARRNGRS